LPAALPGGDAFGKAKCHKFALEQDFYPVAVLPVEYKACNVHVHWWMCSLLLDKSNAANLDAKNVWSNTVTLGYTEYGNAGQYGPMLLIFITATLSTQMTLNIITRSFSATMLILLVAPC